MGNKQTKRNLKGDLVYPGMGNGTGHCLDIPEYQHWFEALRHNDVDYVQETLDVSEPDEKERLLNGRFHYQKSDDNLAKEFASVVDSNHFTATRPFIMSALFGSNDVTSCLMEHGARVDCLEDNGSNFVHIMVSASSAFPQHENGVIESYKKCCELIGEKQMGELLRTENVDGLRPLELAAKLGACKMVRAIMETPGVYLVREEKRGMAHFQWIDITEYETRKPKLDRRDKSPLGFLTMMDEKTLLTDGTKELFEWRPFKLWCSAKIQAANVLLFFWLLLRLSIISTYIILVADKSLLYDIGGISDIDLARNSSRNHTFVFCSSFVKYNLAPKTRTILFVYMGVMGYLTVIFDIAEVVVMGVRRTPKYLCALNSLRPALVVTVLWYRFNQFVLAFLFAFVATVKLGDFDQAMSESSIQVINVVCMVAITFSIMFFFQMMPVIGIYVISVKRMLRDLLNFSFMYLLWVTPFSVYFMVFFNTSSKTQCVHEFSSITESMYSTFRMMLNMLDLTAYDVHLPQIVDFMHVIYVFTVAILLINFLIAVMSTSAARIALCEDVILRLERLYIATIVEFRLDWLFHDLMRRCKGRVVVVKESHYQLLNIEYK